MSGEQAADGPSAGDARSASGAPRQRPSVLCRELDDEIVLFSRDDGRSIHLNRTAGLIWYFCDGEHDEAQICEELRHLFPAHEHDRIAREVPEAVKALRENNLLE